MKTFQLDNGTITSEELHNKIKEALNKTDKSTFSLNFARNAISKDCVFVSDTEAKRALWYTVQDNNLTAIVRVKRGVYKFNDESEINMSKKNSLPDSLPASLPINEDAVSVDGNVMNLVPLKSPEFVAHGCYDVVKTVISKNIFAPVWIAGESGNGKTFGVEQACAAAKRELVILNISNETSEEDLIGSYVLKNGDMVWNDGPVIVAMRRGAVLCLDEIDQARSSIMALNTIAQGKPYYIKKTNELVVPQKGFTLIGTANTKGDGNGMDKFTGAQVMNEAFLERFAIIVEQDYPDKNTEKKILMKHSSNKNFISTLIDIAYSTRQGYKNGDLDIVLTTRRLVQIAKNYEIFNDEDKAINFAIARFNSENQEVIRELYKALVAEHKKREQQELDKIAKQKRDAALLEAAKTNEKINKKPKQPTGNWLDADTIVF